MPGSQHGPSGIGHEPHSSLFISAAQSSVHCVSQQVGSTAHTHASIAASPHSGPSCAAQQSTGSPVVPDVEPVVVVPTVESVVPVLVVVVDGSVVGPAVVGSVVVGALVPVPVPGFDVVDVEATSVVPVPVEPPDELALSVVCGESSLHAETSGESATNTRVSEAKLRKGALLKFREFGAGQPEPQYRSAQDGTLGNLYTRKPPQFLTLIAAVK